MRTPFDRTREGRPVFDSWMAALLMVLAFLPVVAVAVYLNRRDPKPPAGDHNDSLNVDDPRFDNMNKQGLGWGTRDNDQGGL